MRSAAPLSARWRRCASPPIASMCSKSIARSVNLRQVMRFVDIDPRRGSMLGGRSVTRQLRQHFGHGHLEDLFLPVAVVAADLWSGSEVALTRGSIVEAVRASIAIPGVFPPVQRGEMLLVDGGVITPVPVRAVRALSSAPVLAINLQGDYQRRAHAGLPEGRRVTTPFHIGRAGLSLLMAHVAKQSLVIDPPDLEIAPGHRPYRCSQFHPRQRVDRAGCRRDRNQLAGHRRTGLRRAALRQSFCRAAQNRATGCGAAPQIGTTSAACRPVTPPS